MTQRSTLISRLQRLGLAQASDLYRFTNLFEENEARRDAIGAYICSPLRYHGGPRVLMVVELSKQLYIVSFQTLL